MATPLLTVVIPTYRRPVCLKQILQDLTKQTFSDFEVLVVCQGGERAVLPSGLEGEVLRLDRPSIVRAKNLAISRARGKIILVLDDDLRLSPDLLEKHQRRYGERGVFAVGGVALEREEFLIKRGGKRFGEFSLVGELNTDYRVVREPVFVSAVPGGNLSFRKTVWQRVGGYDENFVGNCVNEDSDFCLRITEMFGKILFDPNIKVTHLRAEGGSRAFGDATSARWYRDLFFNHLYFYRKHWRKAFLPLFFTYRLRQVYTCVVKYGKFRPAYLKAPLMGYRNALSQPLPSIL